MRPPVDIWQGCSNYWQANFIRENFLALGHAAWQGYLIQGRGMVVCEVKMVRAVASGWSSHVTHYSLEYIPAAAMPSYLRRLPERLPEEVIDRLIETLSTYRPEQEMLLALQRDGRLEVDWLQNLAIAPPDCHRQVCRRWVEFSPGIESERRCNDANC